jgi:pimeloyl-ACP methyl ester carboxylesterase
MPAVCISIKGGYQRRPEASVAAIGRPALTSSGNAIRAEPIRSDHRVPPPRVEGSITLSDGRRLGFAEYGPATGKPILWFHGTPGARRQVPALARVAAVQRNVRLIALERPGVGFSTPHMYGTILDWARDVEEYASRVEVERFALIGLSGGGPYVLACAAWMPQRVVGGAVLGGVAPSRGEDATPGGVVGLAARVAPVLNLLREPIAHGLWLGAQAIRPFASQAFDLYMRTSPEGDKRIFSDPQMKAMLLDDLLRGSQSQLRAPIYDLVLFTRPWGFSVRDIVVPIQFWHGDSDNIVPLSHGTHLASLLGGSELSVRPGESHLGGLGAAGEVVDSLLRIWPPQTTRDVNR